MAIVSRYEHRLVEISFLWGVPLITITRNNRVTTRRYCRDMRRIKQMIGFREPVYINLNNGELRYYLPKLHRVYEEVV